MKEKKIVRMLESLPKFETYSQYNSTLEKLFKSKSLKNFIQNLKNQKTINEISLLDKISKVNTDEPIDIYADDDLDLKKIQNDEDYDIFEEVSEERDHPHNKKNEKAKMDSWRNNAVDLKRKKLHPSLDPFKYNPNYNSIYKNVPCFKIIDPKNRIMSLKNISKSKKIINDKEKPFITEAHLILRNNKISQTPTKKSNILNTIGNIGNMDRFNSINNKKGIRLPKLTKKNNIMDSIKLDDNDNHALRFSKYIPRKYLIPENNKIISYLNPINHIKSKKENKAIDFDKMLHRNGKNMINVSCLKNPSFGHYNPKYTVIDKNENVRLFNPEEKEHENNKKYLMRKLWASYNVNTEYTLVDNNKINN